MLYPCDERAWNAIEAMDTISEIQNSYDPYLKYFYLNMDRMDGI